MTSPRTKPMQSRPRRVQLTLRNADVVEGGVFLSDGQALAPYLGSRKNGWVNVVSAVWRSEGELHHHAVLQTDHIVMATALDVDCPVQLPLQGAVPRDVDIMLHDGSRFRGSLHLGEQQRLSDYLAGCGRFLPLLGVTRVADAEAIGDLALNAGCVKAVRDARVFDPGTRPSAEEARASWGGYRRGSTSLGATHAFTPVAGHVVEVVTPGRVPDRRSVPHFVPTPLDTEAIVSRPTPAMGSTPVPAGGKTGGRRTPAPGIHWLLRLAEETELALPDAPALAACPDLAALWAAIADCNDMAEAELAVYVAAAHRLELATLDEATPEALRRVPPKLARRLGVLPLSVDGRYLTIAVSEPASHDVEQQIGFVTRLHLREVIATPSDIAGAIEWHYGSIPDGDA